MLDEVALSQSKNRRREVRGYCSPSGTHCAFSNNGIVCALFVRFDRAWINWTDLPRKDRCKSDDVEKV